MRAAIDRPVRRACPPTSVLLVEVRAGSCPPCEAKFFEREKNSTARSGSCRRRRHGQQREVQPRYGVDPVFMTASSVRSIALARRRRRQEPTGDDDGVIRGFGVGEGLQLAHPRSGTRPQPMRLRADTAVFAASGESGEKDHTRLSARARADVARAAPRAGRKRKGSSSTWGCRSRAVEHIWWARRSRACIDRALVE